VSPWLQLPKESSLPVFPLQAAVECSCPTQLYACSLPGLEVEKSPCLLSHLEDTSKTTPAYDFMNGTEEKASMEDLSETV